MESVGRIVVVGVDGSELSTAAALWAADEARRRRRGLLVLYGFDWPLLGTSMRTAPMRALRDEARQTVDDTIARVRTAVPEVPVQGEVRTGRAGALLAAASAYDEMTVIGSHGRGRIAAVLPGSTSRYLTAHASGPVVVLPPGAGDRDDRAEVVVGTDGRPTSRPAVEFAFEEAELRRVPLVVVHAWRAPVPAGPGDMLPLVYDVDEVGEQERRLLSESIAGQRSEHPDVPVRQRVGHASTAGALAAAADRACLVVVGASRHARFDSMARLVLHRCPTPVVVVPAAVRAV